VTAAWGVKKKIPNKTRRSQQRAETRLHSEALRPRVGKKTLAYVPSNFSNNGQHWEECGGTPRRTVKKTRKKKKKQKTDHELKKKPETNLAAAATAYHRPTLTNGEN